MAAHTSRRHTMKSGYAGLNFIKAAFCPLEFNAIRLGNHPLYRRLRRDEAPALAFDYELYRELSPVMRRFYLIANRDGWNQKNSSVFLADDFTIHQIGYSERPALERLRLQKLRRLLSEAEDRGFIRPFYSWKGYLQVTNTGPAAGRLAVRWSRGPALRTKSAKTTASQMGRIEDDALYAQVGELRDEDGQPMNPLTYHRLLSKFGRGSIQKHVAVILAQKEQHPGSFTKSEVAALVDRIQHDYAEPDWYQDLKRAERLSPFERNTAQSTFDGDVRGILSGC